MTKIVNNRGSGVRS